ncbi:MAG TPA: RpiB/LacA/LacB family sugar-phosphate isomerase, partial [Acidimicrobiales bacterium]|nr:RpiB/LacA/LacB family sugar-phosphate isomerase [Acidimicrobiales bacterium]
VDGLADFGVVIGGSGQGEQIAANKVNGVRAALCHDEWMARMARMHNNANVLAFGARVLADARALDIVDLFIATEFEGGRHQPRIEQVAGIEAQECEKRSASSA